MALGKATAWDKFKEKATKLFGKLLSHCSLLEQVQSAMQCVYTTSFWKYSGQISIDLSKDAHSLSQCVYNGNGQCSNGLRSDEGLSI